MFVTEALHPYNVFREAGFEVDLVSETGSYQADWLSEQKGWLGGEDRKVWEDPQSAFRQKVDAHLKPSDIDPSNVWCPTTQRPCMILASLDDTDFFEKPVWHLLCVRRPCFTD